MLGDVFIIDGCCPLVQWGDVKAQRLLSLGACESHRPETVGFGRSNGSAGFSIQEFRGLKN